jgi:tetratricopeptide (TPR) repeat protein
MSRPLALGLALASTMWVMPTLARAENPFDAEQHRLAREVQRAARSPRAVLPLIELFRHAEDADPAVTRAALSRLAAERRLPAHLRAYAGALLARMELRAGDAAGAEARIDELGYVRDFHVVGPFDNEGKAGFDRADAPEQLLTGPFDAEARFEGKEREVAMRVYPNVSAYGYVNLDAVLRPYENVCGYAFTTVTSDEAKPLGLWVGGGGATKVWWNGELVHRDPGYRQPHPDRSVAMVGAHAGPNRLAVKVCVTDATWGFFLRVADPSGAPASGMEASSAEMPLTPAGHGVTPAAALRTPFEALGAAAEGARATAQDLEDFARFLAYTGSDDPAERRARQLAARAAEMQPTAERLELAATLADQRGEVMRFVARALELAPRDPEVQLLEAQLRSTSLYPPDALPLIDRLPEAGRVAVEAAILRAEVLRGMGLTEAALAALDHAAELAPGSHRVVRAQLAAAEEAGHADQVVATASAALALRWDDVSSRRKVLADALRRGEKPVVLEHLAVLRRLGRDDGEALGYVAAIHQALDRNDDALEAIHEARELAPPDAGPAVTEGRLLLRMGQRDAAADALREALALRPQDADTRELLEQLRPEARPDERYAADRETLLARRGEADGYPMTILEDLTVNTVFDNGLGSSFRQLAVQVHDEEGARQLRTYPIQFDPSSQRIDVRLARIYRANGEVLEGLETYEQSLGEPWYRIYYDTRALVVVLPDLEPGDTVELRYRIDDVTHRNLFADYYGDLHFLQGSSPVKHLEYVLITPASREFYFNEPRLTGLEHERTVTGGTRTDRFFAENVAPVRREEHMPGPTEIMPYLHVSTYQSWEDIGRWYWGLIQDQLYVDASLRRTVAELVQGAPDVETKVRRIHDWVVAHTRYVGLEFGIHGYKPYRVSQIVDRGFGDCKDKASLLYAMFREAGIDAHLVLVRTRRNGSIPDLPASLAVFDHAIAYVPELDLYIDGTAEHSGVTELPEQDQGVAVLHVWPGGSELRRTPVLPAALNARQRSVDVALAADGTGVIEVEETVHGVNAAYYRSTYEAEGTRAERFERALRSLFPGLRLLSQVFDHLGDLDKPVVYRYRAEVPQLAQTDGSRLRVSASSMVGTLQRLATSPTRQHVLELGAPSRSEETRTIHLPAGASAEQVPEGGTAESPFGTVMLRITREGDRILARTEIEVRTDRVAPDQYEAFRRWVQEADQILRQRITIEAPR